MLYRIIDANINRLREGLRVVEDAARFLLDDAKILAVTKKMRHDLARFIDGVPGGQVSLVEARNSSGDVGRETRLASEMARGDFYAVTAANLKRVQEAARVLEEYGKLIDPGLGAGAKALRFQSYELEKVLLPEMNSISGAGSKKLDISLYVITGEKFSRGRPLLQVVEEALKGGATVIQLREKEYSARRLVDAGNEIRKLTGEYGATFIVNDRVDVARAVNADGVHLGQDDLPVATAREMLGPGKLVGVSTHSLEQALQAEREGADYIGVGPVFETNSKEDVCASVGIELVRDVAGAVKIPRVAIGGIKAHNASAALEAGAGGIAVITAVTGAEDVASAAGELKRIVKEQAGVNR